MILAKTENIKARMARQGFTGSELAKRVGISQSYVVQVIASRRTILPTTARKICDVLSCEFDEIFELKNTPQRKRP